MLPGKPGSDRPRRDQVPHNRAWPPAGTGRLGRERVHGAVAVAGHRVPARAARRRAQERDRFAFELSQASSSEILKSRNILCYYLAAGGIRRTCGTATNARSESGHQQHRQPNAQRAVPPAAHGFNSLMRMLRNSTRLLWPHKPMYPRLRVLPLFQSPHSPALAGTSVARVASATRLR